MSEVYVDVTRLGASLDSQIGSAVAGALTTSIQNSLALIKDEWQRRAQSSLKSTLPLYLMGLDFNSVVYPYGNDPLSGAVILRGTLPNMLENGFGPFDEKVGFSKSSRKHISKNGGWYLTIPMRHSTPGSFMYGKPMTTKIYNQAKKLGNGDSLSVSGDQQMSWTGYMHKANINDGLTRIVKSYQNVNTGKTTKQSQYLTFRRVSNNSDPLSWWHPGYSGVKIASQLQSYAESTFKTMVEKNLNEVLK